MRTIFIGDEFSNAMIEGERAFVNFVTAFNRFIEGFFEKEKMIQDDNYSRIFEYQLIVEAKKLREMQKIYCQKKNLLHSLSAGVSDPLGESIDALNSSIDFTLGLVDRRIFINTSYKEQLKVILHSLIQDTVSPRIEKVQDQQDEHIVVSEPQPIPKKEKRIKPPWIAKGVYGGVKA